MNKYKLEYFNENDVSPWPYVLTRDETITAIEYSGDELLEQSCLYCTGDVCDECSRLKKKQLLEQDLVWVADKMITEAFGDD